MEQTKHHPEKNNRELEPGEMICPKCKGEGAICGKDSIYDLTVTCSKCNGEGIIDWVSNAMGKPKTEDYHFAVSDVNSSYPVYSSAAVNSYVDNSLENLSDVITDMLAKKIAEEIDNEIMRSLMGAEEQNLKGWMVKEGVDIDNGIVS